MTSIRIRSLNQGIFLWGEKNCLIDAYKKKERKGEFDNLSPAQLEQKYVGSLASGALNDISAGMVKRWIEEEKQKTQTIPRALPEEELDLMSRTERLSKAQTQLDSGTIKPGDGKSARQVAGALWKVRPNDLSLQKNKM